MFHVADDAHDLAYFFSGIVRGKTRLDMFADNILAREKFLDEALVHDHDRWRGELVALVDNAAGPEGNPHRLEIIGPDDPDGGGRALSFRQRMILGIERGHHVTAAQRQRENGAGGFDPGNGADPRQELIEEGGNVLVLWIADVGQSDARSEKPLGAEAGLDPTE